MKFFQKLLLPAIFLKTLTAATLFIILCTKDYDPFSDLTNAKIHVLEWDFAGKDSVALYTTATLKVIVALREEVDSFAIHADSNRFWRDTVIRKTATKSLSSGPYVFSVSFYGAGLLHVLIKTYRSNNEILPQDLVVRVFSPLHQDPINRFFGEKFTLSTDSAGDKDIFYHWKFGNTREDSSVSPKMEIIFSLFNPVKDTGKLWITDLSGKFPTPAATFLYDFRDTAPPIITCLSAGLQNDTIFTGDTLLSFKAYIVDQGGVAAESCSVNNMAFDFVNSNTHVYTMLYKNMPALTQNGTPLPIVVYAIDNQQFHNVAKHTFWAVFIPGGVTTSDVRLDFLKPKSDTVLTPLRDYNIVGNALSYRGDTILAAAKVNGVAVGTPQTIIKNGSWNWTVHLDTIYNTVMVRAYDPFNRSADSAKKIIIYDVNAVDTIPPMIYEISVNGRPADGLDTNADGVNLRIVAFDDGSGIKDLEVQGHALSADTAGYIWYFNAAHLVHSIQGNTFGIKAVDNSGNHDSVTITIFKNSPPLLVKDPAIPVQMCTDTADTFYLSPFDEDGDKITINKVHAPSKMTISPTGMITWKPTVADTGLDSLVLFLSDTFTANKPHHSYQWNFSCIRCAQPLPIVRFTTTTADFPGVLQAVADTLRITLAIDSVGLLPMLRFTAWFTDNGKRIMDNSPSPMLLWVPTDADTGKRRLMVTVGNGTNAFDTLNPVMTIVPKNKYPCSLSYRFSGTIDSTGVLDLFSHPAPETLFFTIHDKDALVTEKYTVTVTQHSVSAIETIQNRDFFVVIQPDSTRGADTLKVSVSDLTHTKDSVRLALRYRPNIPPSLLVRLYLNTKASGAGITGKVLNFPVLVRLTGSNFDFSRTLPKGEDVRFRKAYGKALPYHIEQWDSAAGTACVWVLADTVYGNDSSHYFELYQIDRPAVDQSNAAAVFDTANSFRGVWHLGENTATMRDATADGFNGTRVGNQQQDAGIIGSGQTFDGQNSYTDMGNVLNPGNSSFTASVWVKRGGNLGAYAELIGKSTGGQPNANYGWLLDFDNMDKVHCFMATSGGLYGGQWGNSGTFDIVSNTTLTDLAQWHFICAVINRSSNNACRLYIDGAEDSSTSRGSIANVDNIGNTVALRIGAEADNEINFKGSIDEAVVSYAARSADWIKLCYMNQKPIDALVVFK